MRGWIIAARPCAITYVTSPIYTYLAVESDDDDNEDEGEDDELIDPTPVLLLNQRLFWVIVSASIIRLKADHSERST